MASKSNLYPTFHNGNRNPTNKAGTPVNEAQVDLLKGTTRSEQAVGVAWHKKEYNEDDLQDNANEQLVQDVSSTAVLTPADDLEGSVEELDDRGNWGGRFDFLMSLLGYSVGLGNVWRFPYLAYMNGGGAFVFPFIVMFLLLGFPLMFLELSFGQYAALGPAAIFDRICPILNGLGYGMISVSFMVCLYYTVIIAWAVLYLVKSFSSELPWERCHPDWAGPTCFSHLEHKECTSVNGSVYFETKCFNASEAERLNISTLFQNETKLISPAEDYFLKGILNQSSGIDELGSIRWPIALSLSITWFITFMALSRGIKSVGKVVYFTALFPYVVLSILFIRGITLDGAADGIIYYLTPQFEKLIEAKTWRAAAVQIFFALSPAWGGLITLSSYNKFHNDCYKDSLIVGVGNICTSIFAGFVIFGIVGYLAKELDMDVDKVVAQGPGLAFIVFPDVVTRLPAPPVWAILFFVMLITLGMGSEIALLETIMTAVQDTYPPLRQKKVWVVATVSVIGLLGGLVITTEGGVYVLTLMDETCAGYAVFFMAFLECLIIGWIYGAGRFLQDIETMIGHKGPGWHMFFKFFWMFLTPGSLLFLFFFNIIDYSPLEYAGKPFPSWANGIGWIFVSIPVVIIFGMGLWRYYRTPEIAMSQQDNTRFQKLKRMFKATPKWGPAYKQTPISDDLNSKLGNPVWSAGGETRI